jgi:hypothetical protein
MLVMVAVNPKNAIKISFSHFACNLTMAVLSLVCPPYFLTQLVSEWVRLSGITVLIIEIINR